MKKPFFALIFACFLLAGCSLFNSLPEADLEKKMDTAIAWAKADRLSVTVACPEAWGMSPQAGTDMCGDIRKDFAFNVEFVPTAAYTLVEWRAYTTNYIQQLYRWQDNDAAALAGVPPLNGIDYPVEFNENGGTFQFNIHIAEPITLIPWCTETPRILTSTSPSVVSDWGFYEPSTPIIINFAVPIKRDAVIFAERYITITMQDIVSGNPSGTPVKIDGLDGSAKLFEDPVISDNQQSVIINPIGIGLPLDKAITVTLGRGLQSSKTSNPPKEETTIRYITKHLSWFVLENTKATYNEDNGTITIDWDKLPGGETPPGVQVYFSQNYSALRELYVTGVSAEIQGVPPLDNSDVRSGRAVSNINRYDIMVQTSGGGNKKLFTIWNIPGMKVYGDDPVTEIANSEELANIKNGLDKQYVLANDIAITGQWIPLGTDSGTSAFRGKFYGNGHSIHLDIDESNGIGSTRYRGLFGYAQNAEIRDLAVIYSGTTLEAASAADIGGIAGYLYNTNVRNVILRGAADSTVFGVTPYSGASVYFGGIAGRTEGSGKIENCYAGLSVRLNAGTCTEAYRIGGVVGQIWNGNGGELITINGVQVPYNAGLVLDKVTIEANVTADKGNNTHFIYMGGAAGLSDISTIRDVSFNKGVISFSRTNSNVQNHCGGLIGQITDTNLTGCTFSGSLETIGTIISTDEGQGHSHMGGLVGLDWQGDSVIDNCRTRGDIKFNGNRGTVNAGGILGITFIGEPAALKITNTYYEGGNITITGSATVYAGGFIGWINSGWLWGGPGDLFFSSCGVLAGNMNINTTSRDVFAGGFVSTNDIGIISNSFTKMDLSVQSTVGAQSIGGFIGQNSGTLTACYASGKVSISHTSNQFTDIGGFSGANWGGIISNCYSLGDVTGNRISTAYHINIGGITSYSWGTIDHCFSKGQVIAMSSGDEAYAGGIIGENEGTLSYCAALGSKVIAAAGTPGQAFAGRIAGAIFGSTITNNYALNSMLLGSGAYAAVIPCYEVTGTTTNVNGANIAMGNTMNESWWRTTLGFGSQRLNGKDIWDFSTVVSMGYPILAGLPGQ